jgi:uncharacterized DUF497 family protein
LGDFDFVEWDAEDDPRSNLRHIADNGLTPDEVEDVLNSYDLYAATSNSTGQPVVFGRTRTGKSIIVVFKRTEENRVVVIRQVTAYEVDSPF